MAKWSSSNGLEKLSASFVTNLRPKAGCTRARHASCALFGRMRRISWRHVLFWCVWYGLRSSKSESEQWVWYVNIETGSYSNADHSKRIRKGRDVTKSDACAQKMHRTCILCIELSCASSFTVVIRWAKSIFASKFTHFHMIVFRRN